MPRFTLTQVLMAVALVGIVAALVKTDALARRYAVVSSLAISSDGQQLALVHSFAKDARLPSQEYNTNLQRAVHLLDYRTLRTRLTIEKSQIEFVQGPRPHSFALPTTEVQFFDDGRSLIVSGFPDVRARGFDCCSGKPLVGRRASILEAFETINIDDDLAMLAASNSNETCVLDTSFCGEFAYIVSTPPPFVPRSPIAFLHDPSRLVTIGVQRSGKSLGLQVWHIGTGNLLDERPFDNEFARPTDMVVANDNRLIVSSWDAIRVCDFAQVDGMQTIAKGFVSDLAIAPDGKELAAIIGGQIRRLDVRTLEPIWTSEPPFAATCVEYSLDSRYLVVGTQGGVLQLWDAITGKLEREVHFGRKQRLEIIAPYGALVLWCLMAIVLLWRRLRQRSAASMAPDVRKVTNTEI